MNLDDAIALETALTAVRFERSRQYQKWGPQHHEPMRWVSILLEEVGEVAAEVNEANETGAPLHPEHYRAELVQVAAVAVAAIEALDAGVGS